MQRVHEIEQAVSKLTKKQLTRFRTWFDEFDAQAWDRQFERDVRSGKLERLAKKAIGDYKAGRCKRL